jgi:hypothetical protein
METAKMPTWPPWVPRHAKKRSAVRASVVQRKVLLGSKKKTITNKHGESPPARSHNFSTRIWEAAYNSITNDKEMSANKVICGHPENPRSMR